MASRILAYLFVLFACFGNSSATCECVLTTPLRIPVSVLGSFSRSCPLNDVTNNITVADQISFQFNNRCPCDQRIRFCLNNCLRFASLPRDRGTTAFWQRWSCNADRRNYNFPGQNMLVAASLKDEAECLPSTQFASLTNRPLCCRRGYSSFMFDFRCTW